MKTNAVDILTARKTRILNIKDIGLSENNLIVTEFQHGLKNVISVEVATQYAQALIELIGRVKKLERSAP